MSQCPLCLDGWLSFNEYKWGLTPQRLRVCTSASDTPCIQAIVYLDTRGRIVQPRLNPYLPVEFSPTRTDSTPRIRRQWIEVSQLLVEEHVKRKVMGSISLPPEVTDMRAWQWRGFIAEPRYTFYLHIPLILSDVDHQVRKQVNKARKAGFEFGRTRDFRKVIECLSSTESRQGFSYGLNHGDLSRLESLLGEDGFRCYAAIAPNGEMASTRIVLKGSGAKAIDWVAGTMSVHLSSGVTQYLISSVLEDLALSAVTTFDYAGANLPSVERAKSTWGGDLKPYFALRSPCLRTLASIGMRFARNRFRGHLHWIRRCHR